MKTQTCILGKLDSNFLHYFNSCGITAAQFPSTNSWTTGANSVTPRTLKTVFCFFLPTIGSAHVSNHQTKKQTICCIWHLNTFSIGGCGVSDAHREKWMRHGNVCLKKKKKKKLAVCEGVTVRMAAFVPSSALDKCLFNASLHNKRLKIPLNIQRLPVPQSSNPWHSFS